MKSMKDTCMVVFWSIIRGSRFGWPFMPRSSWRSWSGTFSFVMFVWLFHYSNFTYFLIFIYHYRMIRDFISDFMTKVKLRCYFRIRFIILFHIITNVLIVHRSFMFVIFFILTAELMLFMFKYSAAGKSHSKWTWKQKSIYYWKRRIIHNH